MTLDELKRAFPDVWARVVPLLAWAAERGVAEQARTALELFVAAHHAQVRKDGRSYLHHPLDVLDRVREHRDVPVHVLWVALLHDAVEDAPEVLDPSGDRERAVRALAERLGPQVASGVAALSNPTDGDYLEHVLGILAGDPWVAVVKLADIRTNALALEHVQDARLRTRLERKYAPLVAALPGWLGGLPAGHPALDVRGPVSSAIEAFATA